MLALWASLNPHDVETYAATLLLPAYLSHLQLSPFSFAHQAANCDGQEPLLLTYVGAGRLEEIPLPPAEHAAGMIRHVCPQLDLAAIQLPHDDARWHWRSAAGPATTLRVYFAPASATLDRRQPRPQGREAYASLTRRHAFIGQTVIDGYWKAWLVRLGIQPPEVSVTLATPAAGIELAAGPVEGQLFLDDPASVLDLLRFAGLEPVLEELHDVAEWGGGVAHIANQAVRIEPEGIFLALPPLIGFDAQDR